MKFDGEVLHYVRVRVGEDLDPAKSGEQLISVPLDESTDGVGRQLSLTAQTLANVIKVRHRLDNEPGVIVNVDGVACSIPISTYGGSLSMVNDPSLANELSKLVVPAGWKPTK